jgi:RpiR family transcriptional regulator, carbohydrate utilization regulator
MANENGASRKKARAGRRGPPQNFDFAAGFAALSPKRQELLRPVLENPRGFVLLSVRELAKRLDVDAATAVRIILKLGFGSYKEFQHYLHELSVAQATSLDTMETSKARGSSLAEHIQEAAERDVQNVQKFRNAMDPQRIAALAKRLHEAQRILILGGDLAANLAGFLHYHLILLGLPAVSAVTSGEAAHLSRAVGKGDVVIALSFRRGLRQTVEGLRQAREQGAYCVGIADTLISPVARFSHECFVASVETPSYGASYAAPMCLLNAIVTGCGYYDRRKNMELLKQVAEEQRHGFRWYKD